MMDVINRFRFHYHLNEISAAINHTILQVYDRMVKQQPIIRDMFTTRTFLSAMSRSDIATLRDHARVYLTCIS